MPEWGLLEQINGNVTPAEWFCALPQKFSKPFRDHLPNLHGTLVKDRRYSS